jgi:2-alkenal reductase
MRIKRWWIFVAALAIAGLSCVTLPGLPAGLSPSTPAPAPSVTPSETARETSTLPGAEILPGSPITLLDAELSELYAQVNPGVVAILTFARVDPSSQESLPAGQGSGFVLDREGHIVTNQHVVGDADEIEIDFPSGFKAWAEVVGTDLDSDLAVLRVDAPPEELQPIPLGNSDLVRVGDPVIAIGNPFGYSGTLTLGVVSGLGRVLESQRAAPGGGFFSAGDLIQTDAAINPGNSGGPLLNLQGQVIGVNRAIRTDAFSTEGNPVNIGIGFAIPVNIVRRVAPALIAEGSYEYPYLGISSISDQAWNLKTVEALGFSPGAQGAYVTCVAPGGPAATAGVRGGGSCDAVAALRPGGDLIVAIDGHPVRVFGDLLSYLLNRTRVGQEVTLTVLREGSTLDLTVTLQPRP